jgi:hypothetical protein
VFAVTQSRAATVTQRQTSATGWDVAGSSTWCRLAAAPRHRRLQVRWSRSRRPTAAQRRRLGRRRGRAPEPASRRWVRGRRWPGPRRGRRARRPRAGQTLSVPRGRLSTPGRRAEVEKHARGTSTPCRPARRPPRRPLNGPPHGAAVVPIRDQSPS